MFKRAIFSSIGRALYLTVGITVSLFCQVRSQSYVQAYNAASKEWGRDWNTVVKNLEEAARIAQLDEGIYDRDYLTILNDLGIAYFENGHVTQSEETFHSLIELYLQLDDFLGSEYWTARLNYARILKMSDPDSSINTYSSLLNSPYLGIRISGLEGVYQTLTERGEIVKAATFLDQIPTDDQPDLFKLRVLLLHLDITRRRGDYSQMDSLFNAFDNGIQNQEDPALLQAAHLGLLEQQGLYWMEIGEFRKAEKAFEDHLAYKEYLGLAGAENTATFNYLATLYADNGLYQQALEKINEALSNCTYGCNALRQNQAVILANTGQVERAREILHEIQETGTFISPEEELSFHLNYLTGASRKTDVSESLRRAAEIVENPSVQLSPMLKASFFEVSGRANLQSGQSKLAIDQLERALEIQTTVLGKKSLRLRTVKNYLGIAYLLNGNPDKSSELLRMSSDAEFRFVKYVYPLLSRSEQMMFLRRLRRDLYLTYSAILDFAPNDTRFLEVIARGQMTYKGLTLNVKRHYNTAIDSTNSVLVEAMSEYNHLRKQLAEEYVGLFRNAETLKIEEIESRISSLESDINRMHPIQETSISVQTTRELTKLLATDEALIEIIRLPKTSFKGGRDSGVSYIAIVMRNEQPMEMVHLSEGEFLENRQLKFYQNSIRYGSQDTTSYSKFWKPIRNKLEGVSRCYIVQDGLFHRVNPGTLLDPFTNKYLTDQFDFVVLGNAQELIKKKSSNGELRSGLNATMVGDPVLSNISGAFEGLPGTRQEIEDISRDLRNGGYQVRNYLGSEATKENLTSMSAAGILHIATHGYFSNQEMVGREKLPDVELFRSGLVLTKPQSDQGDLLSAFEVTGLDLRGTDLVVLSACETGLGELQHGDGVYGLQYAFFVAGARTLILSLWKVEDQITREFMTEFYRRLLKTTNKRQAFRQTVDLMKQSHPDPKVWGAFTYLGD